jgi:hypothetical protein
MKWKVLGLILVIAGFSGVAVYKPGLQGRQLPKDVPSEGRLRWHAQQAKSDGNQKVKVPTLLYDYGGSSNALDIDQALFTYTALVAKPIDKRSYEYTSNDIVTWYKFATIEALSETRKPTCSTCDRMTPPPEMLPLKSGEFFVVRNGGSLIVDGVEVEQEEPGYPPFREGQKYLLLVSMYPSGVASTAGGPLGVFTLDDNGIAAPINSKSHRLKTTFNNEFGASVNNIRQKLKQPR